MRKTKKIKGVTRISPHFTGDEESIKETASLLANAKNPLIVAGDAVGYADAWTEIQQLAELIGAPVVLQSFSSVANYPNNDCHWQGELPGSQAGVQGVFKDHDVAFLIGFGAQAQVAVFKYSDGALIPEDVKLAYLTNNTWDIAKNFYGETAILGDIKSTLPLLNKYIKQQKPKGADIRNKKLKALDVSRAKQWDVYYKNAMKEPDIWAVVIAKALKEAIESRKLVNNYVYVHEAVSDGAPFQYYLPLGTNGAKPISYYCVAGGSLGWSMPASLGIKLENKTSQGIGTKLVINAVGDGSSLFYPQTWWTAAHEKLPILYIITNNQEYHTLQLGLQQVVAAYGNAPGYGWKPKTMDPDYLKLERPKLDFVSLAKAFGGEHGEIVLTADKVKEAVERGINHVLNTETSYILDMRIASNTPPLVIKSNGDTFTVDKRYALQPPLNIFYQDTLMKKSSVKNGSLKTGEFSVNENVSFNLPSLF